MRRSAFLLLVPLVGCAKKPDEPSVVKLPEGLARPSETAQVAKHAGASPVERRDAPPVGKTTPSVSSNLPVKRTSVVTQPRRDGFVATPPPRPPSVPAMPKADETHRLGYRTVGGSALEVEGVCRFDESSVECWDGEGKRDAALTSRVESGLAQHPDYNNLQIRYGMKNRILVVRQTTVPTMNGQGDRRNLSLMSVGTDARYGYGGNVQLPEERTEWKPGAAQVRRETRVFAEGKSAHETQMRVMMNEPMEKSVDLKLSVGSSATLDGCTFRIVFIGSAGADAAGWMGPSAGKMWSVKIVQSGKPARPASFYPRTETAMYVDKAGKAVDAKTYMDWQRKRMESMRTSGGPFNPSEEPYRMVGVNMRRTVRPSGEETEILLNADPQALGKIVMSGSYVRTIDVTGIPLDPK